MIIVQEWRALIGEMGEAEKCGKPRSNRAISRDPIRWVGLGNIHHGVIYSVLRIDHPQLFQWDSAINTCIGALESGAAGSVLLLDVSWSVTMLMNDGLESKKGRCFISTPSF